MRRSLILVSVAAIPLVLAGCGSSVEQRTLSGGAIGAVGGAGVAAATGGSVAAGAAIGGAAGAVTGAVTRQRDLDLTPRRWHWPWRRR
ncbi:MAG: hypothetical protein KDJ77_14455 [Rhodobiaceae bacterium]|nr:hypothetical protein [Rhodobiaceae bacterium]